jgi:hypothetical protein
MRDISAVTSQSNSHYPYAGWVNHAVINISGWPLTICTQVTYMNTAVTEENRLKFLTNVIFCHFITVPIDDSKMTNKQLITKLFMITYSANQEIPCPCLFINWVLKQSTTGPYPEMNETSPHPPTLSLHFKINLISFLSRPPNGNC